jgi:hypothetical protein
MRTMMRIRIAVLALATGMSSVAIAAPMEVALVENVMGAPAGVELMDYVETGKTIQLGARDGIVLSYMNSCVRETITGGTVTVGTEQSDVQGGRVARSKVACDAGKLVLDGNKPGQFAGRIFRSASAGPSATDPKLVLYGRAPILEMKAPGTLLIERLDQSSERYLLDVTSEQLVSGKFYDFARWGRNLAAGGRYRISLDAKEVTFKVDPGAQPGNTPILGRLLRFAPPG